MSMQNKEMEPYRRLAARLDSLPNGFPPTEDGVELRLLARLFTPEEAGLAAQLSPYPEDVDSIAERIGEETKTLKARLKTMARSGLIRTAKTRRGLGFALMPFVVGIYEMQVDKIDEELARLFEDYYQRVFNRMLPVEPNFHRVVPVEESVRVDMEVQPFESVTEIIHKAKAWAVMDCICRKQKALIGEPCEHPLEVCMIMSDVPGVFQGRDHLRSLTEIEARDLLSTSAEAGLVHCVSNTQEGTTYICNCCTCACGILRGMAEFGLANVVARSPFVNQVDPELCTACGLCEERCPFEAIRIEDVAMIDEHKCLGCGVCTLVCVDGAMTLVRRPESQIVHPPVNEAVWGRERAAARGLAS
jgi:electron transport complex protein RnfB